MWRKELFANMRRCVFQFTNLERLELVETHFIHPIIGEERRCIRGKRSGAYRGYSTFQWTRAVQALSLLMLEAARRCYAPSHSPLLVGGPGSFASSLDYAIEKQTTWLYEMFGWDEKGRGISRQLFIRSNPGQRLPAPVAIALNRTYIDPREIEVRINSIQVRSAPEFYGLIQQIASPEQQEPIAIFKSQGAI